MGFCNHPASNRDRGVCILAIPVGANLLRVLLSYRRSADKDLHFPAKTRVFQCGDGSFHRRQCNCRQRGEADNVILVLLNCPDELLRSNVDSEVVNVEAASFEHGGDQVLSDVV